MLPLHVTPAPSFSQGSDPLTLDQLTQRCDELQDVFRQLQQRLDIATSVPGRVRYPDDPTQASGAMGRCVLCELVVG